MPPHLANRALFRPSPSTKHDWAEDHAAKARWPINEVVLRTLILSGKTDAQIAVHYGVSEQQVQDLRLKHEL